MLKQWRFLHQVEIRYCSLKVNDLHSRKLGMLNLDSFIANEMLLAQPHPLAENLDKQLPHEGTVSRKEIWEIQRRDRIPGLIKRLVPLNPVIAWEYWWCVPGRMLLPEDMELLRSDRQRVEAILAKLVWLLGGHCFTEKTRQEDESKPVHDWQEVLAFVQRSGFSADLLDIDFLPTAIHQDFQNGNSTEDDTPKYVAIEPAHWHVEFFQLLAVEGGFRIQEPKRLCSCQIWSGRPFMKNLNTGETKTRYDLWISSPHDMIAFPLLQSV